MMPVRHKSGPGSRGAKFELSKNGKIQYFHHNTKHPSGHGLGHPFVNPIKSVIKPIVIKKTAKPEAKEKPKLTTLAKPSKTKHSKTVNHHVAAGHSNYNIKRG